MEIEDHTLWEPIVEDIRTASLPEVRGTCREVIVRFCLARDLPYPPRPVVTRFAALIIARTIRLKVAERGLK